MDDNVFTEADASAPELEATAAIEPVENTTPEEPSAEAEAPKTFTQEDLDAIVGKRLAREQRKWEREQAQRAEEMQARQQPIHDITPEQFETYEDYAEVLAERKAEELLARREKDSQQRAMLESYHEREEAARDKYDDFEQVAYNPSLPITDAMALAIQASDIGPDVIYHLGLNQKDAQRISRMDPILQAREIGMIEARLFSRAYIQENLQRPGTLLLLSQPAPLVRRHLIRQTHGP